MAAMMAHLFLLSLFLLCPVTAANSGEKNSKAQLHEVRAKELDSKWFARQSYFLLEVHGMQGQKLHEDLLPALQEVADSVKGRVTVGKASCKDDASLVAKLGADNGKMPALYLYRYGKILRKWEPVSSWVREGEDIQAGRVKEVSAEDIIEWLEERIEKNEKAERKEKKKQKKDAKSNADL
mmetsp:Transcript_115610/g.288917  ORF Transcript_115610/g.288917 Transcript_115610/m.288917 type:complete len:181 (+) Transcript_115610:46-588(+)